MFHAGLADGSTSRAVFRVGFSCGQVNIACFHVYFYFDFVTFMLLFTTLLLHLTSSEHHVCSATCMPENSVFRVGCSLIVVVIDRVGLGSFRQLTEGRLVSGDFKVMGSSF